MQQLNRGKIILSILLNNYDNDFLSKKENIFILLLLLDHYNCVENDILSKVNIKTSRKFNSYLKQAQVKILVNVKFRNKYFNIEGKIKDII